MTSQYASLFLSMGCALGAGSLIGLERSFHGRPAGFRTHALVCLASALLMLLTTHQQDWLGDIALNTIRTDPTRMAQGIMTGIGFLGAGVIFKEGLTVRGLTTAASIWMTAALGILYGVELYLPAVVATLATLAVLAIFRYIEYRIPMQTHIRHVLRFPRDASLEEEDIRSLLRDHGFDVATISYRVVDEGRIFEYEMVIRTYSAGNVHKLAETLRKRTDVLEYSLSLLGI